MLEVFEYCDVVKINNKSLLRVGLLMSRWKWVRLSRILGWEVADPRTSGTLYKTVFQEIILFGSDTWVMTLMIRRTLVRFHYRVAC